MFSDDKGTKSAAETNTPEAKKSRPCKVCPFCGTFRRALIPLRNG